MSVHATTPTALDRLIVELDELNLLEEYGPALRQMIFSRLAMEAIERMATSRSPDQLLDGMALYVGEDIDLRVGVDVSELPDHCAALVLPRSLTVGALLAALREEAFADLVTANIAVCENDEDRVHEALDTIILKAGARQFVRNNTTSFMGRVVFFAKELANG